MLPRAPLGAVCRSLVISGVGNTAFSVPNLQNRNTGTQTLASGDGPEAVSDRIFNGLRRIACT